jgi:hypothetical protein
MNTAPNNNGGRRAWPTAVALLGACLIFAALVWAMKHYTQPAPLGQDRAAVRAKNLAELRAAEAEALNNAAWIDPGKGVVRLPIAEAIKLAERLWQNPSQARSNLIARVEKATATAPNPFE